MRGEDAIFRTKNRVAAGQGRIAQDDGSQAYFQKGEAVA
jgi:hypothetical protein